MMKAGIVLVTLSTILVTLPIGEVDARIVRVEITRSAPAFGGRSFGEIGTFDHLVGKAHGEVDPNSPSNSSIQDIALAPRNARGMVEYTTDVEIVRPSDRSKSNGLLFFNVNNRGYKGGLALFNIGIPAGPANLADNNALTEAGDGFMQLQGYTMVWFGWQPDVTPGMNRMTMKVPTARNADGTSITGIVRSEIIVSRNTSTVGLQSGGAFTVATAPYPTVNVDNKAPLEDGFLPTLTVRDFAQGPRSPIPNSEWSFASCEAGKEVVTSETSLCLSAGFKPGRLYELTYRARDPLVLGLGFAATRDLGAYLKSAERDDAGVENPAFVRGAKSILMGSSQSGRFIRSLIHLGFNRDEQGRLVFEGALPHIGGGLMPLNLRFGQPGRALTHQIDQPFPGADFPFAYGRLTDPLTGRTQGILDRCAETDTCPRIVHAATSLEMWELRQSLGFTDPLGKKDLAEPANVRSYIMASTQHGPASLPLPTQPPFGACVQQQNPNPQAWTMRALLVALAGWVKDGTEPPPSARPTIAAGTLVAPNEVKFPQIPANKYGNVVRPAVRFVPDNNPLHARDFGEGYDPATTSGIQPANLPKDSSERYGNLVAQVDADGNDLDGIRNLFVEVPIGTYTGWNQFNSGLFGGAQCTLAGSFVPFARTRQERLENGDPRPSIEERYPTTEAYVGAVRRAANDLVARRFLLREDAARLIRQAETEGIRSAP